MFSLSPQWPSTLLYSTSRIYWTATSANGSAAPSTGGAWSEPFPSRATCTAASVVLQGRGPCWSPAVGLTEEVRTNECWYYWCSSCPRSLTHTQKQKQMSKLRASLFFFYYNYWYTTYSCRSLLLCNCLPYSQFLSFPTSNINLLLKVKRQWRHE